MTKEVDKYRHKTSFKYQIQFDEPVESRCQKSLKPGSRLESVRGESFMFSGTMIDAATGITVAHAVTPEEEVMILRPQNGNEVRQVIGRCLKTFQDVQVRGERYEYTMTADMAVLELLPDFQLRRNSVQMDGREFRVKIYKGKRVPRNTPVMVVDQTGRIQKGFIRREQFTDTTLEARRTATNNLYNVLGIGNGSGMDQSAITQEGDSGALVLSLPSESSADSEDDVLYVYGIVTALYSWPENGAENSLTIANSLGGVIPVMFEDESVVHKVGNIPVDDIDFTQIAEPSSLP